MSVAFEQGKFSIKQILLTGEECNLPREVGKS
jgi:hypothetical protein